MPDPEVVEGIVKGLTPRQREVLLACGSQPRRAINFYGDVAAKLRFPTSKRPALTDRNISREHGRRTAWYFLTPLGIACRNRILSEQE